MIPPYIHHKRIKCADQIGQRINIFNYSSAIRASV